MRLTENQRPALVRSQSIRTKQGRDAVSFLRLHSSSPDDVQSPIRHPFCVNAGLVAIVYVGKGIFVQYFLDDIQLSLDERQIHRGRLASHLVVIQRPSLDEFPCPV